MKNLNYHIRFIHSIFLEFYAPNWQLVVRLVRSFYTKVLLHAYMFDIRLRAKKGSCLQNLHYTHTLAWMEAR